MKMTIALCMILTFHAVSIIAAPVEFAPGGTTYDFQKISDQRFTPSDTKSENHFGTWKPSSPWVHLGDNERANSLRPKITPLVEFKTLEMPEGKVLQIIKKNDIEEIAGADAANISGSWYQNLKLPDTSGGRYNLKFNYRSKRTGEYAAAGYVIITFADADNKKQSVVKRYQIGNGTENQLFSSQIEVPGNTSRMEVYLRLDGCGEVIFIEPKLSKTQESTPISLILAPGSLLDNTFALSQNDPAIITFAWQRNIPREKLQLTNPVLHLQLPPGVVCKSGADPLELIGGKDGHWQLSMKKIRDRLKIIDGYDSYLLLPAMLYTELAPGSLLGEAHAWITDGEEVVSNKSVFTFSVIQQVSTAKKAEIFLNGFQVGGRYLNFHDLEARKLWAEFVGRTGMRWLVSGDATDTEVFNLYRESGISIITPELYWISNGYRIGPPQEKPEYAKYKTLGVTNDSNILNGTCPTAIYHKTDYFTKTIVPYLKKNLKGSDGVIANWEPYMFHGMGCFCDNCRDEFITFSKLSASEASKAWPQELLINRKYHELGIKFRSWQHAKMVKTINDAVNEVTTGKAGFIPEVAWIHMVDCAARKAATGEHDPLDYAGELKYIDPWGPYASWKALEPYQYNKGINLDTYMAACDIVDFTNHNFKVPNRPKLLALPHGMQSGWWITQPEATAMEVLGFFVAGFDATTLYFFPRGYDNRFWEVQSKVNNLIAVNESMVSGGERIPVTATPFSPFPTPKKRINAKYYPNYPEQSLFQASAFRKDGKILIATGNFWEKGDVFFTCHITGLDPSMKYVVREAEFNRTYTGVNGKNYSGEELSNGFKLHVGALRWAFFLIEPADSPSTGTVVKPQDFKLSLDKRMESLEAAAAIEAKRDQTDELQYRQSELKSMSAGNLNCHPAKDSDGGQVLEFRSGENSLTLALKGMVVQNWQIDDKEMLGGSSSNGLAMAFWQPSLQIEQPFFLTEQKTVPNGISVTAERTLTQNDAVALANCKIRQTLEINDTLTTIKIITEIINISDAESGMTPMNIGFRYHIMPLCLGYDGEIELGKDKVKFKRKWEQLVFSNGDNQAAISLKKLFDAPGSLIPINGAEALWRSPVHDITIEMNLHPAEQFAGIACWDTPNLKTPTMEPFFREITLQPDQKVEYSLTLEAK